MKKDTILLFLGAGKGIRFGERKQFIKINNIPLYVYTLQKFSKYDIIFTVPSAYKLLITKEIKKYHLNNVKVIEGGESRQESVRLSLEFIDSLPKKYNNVIISDVVRPFISSKSLNAIEEGLLNYSSVIAVSKSVNTSCVSKDKNHQDIVLDRTYMYEMLMPQGFNFHKLLLAHRESLLKDATDDTVILKKVFPQEKVKIVEIPFWEGLKLTNKEDYPIFNFLLGSN
jgi:2-C-methyl-D-erythritol 4-phosphate cytidylyltransferase